MSSSPITATRKPPGRDFRFFAIAAGGGGLRRGRADCEGRLDGCPARLRFAWNWKGAGLLVEPSQAGLATVVLTASHKG